MAKKVNQEVFDSGLSEFAAEVEADEQAEMADTMPVALKQMVICGTIILGSYAVINEAYDFIKTQSAGFTEITHLADGDVKPVAIVGAAATALLMLFAFNTQKFLKSPANKKPPSSSP